MNLRAAAWNLSVVLLCCLLSVRLCPAEGSALPRSALHHRGPRLLLLLSFTEGHKGKLRFYVSRC